MDKPSEFILKLLNVAPGFRSVYADHLRENDELLPHVLMGDFTRWYIQLFRDSQNESGLSMATRRELDGVSRFLEDEWEQGYPEVRELLVASFLENLHQANDDYIR